MVSHVAMIFCYAPVVALMDCFYRRVRPEHLIFLFFFLIMSINYCS